MEIHQLCQDEYLSSWLIFLPINPYMVLINLLIYIPTGLVGGHATLANLGREVVHFLLFLFPLLSFFFFLV